MVARTALGTMGYREIGHGPALVMITGFGAGMDDWAPYFVNARPRTSRSSSSTTPASARPPPWRLR